MFGRIFEMWVIVMLALLNQDKNNKLELLNQTNLICDQEACAINGNLTRHLQNRWSHASPKGMGQRGRSDPQTFTEKLGFVSGSVTSRRDWFNWHAVIICLDETVGSRKSIAKLDKWYGNVNLLVIVMCHYNNMWYIWWIYNLHNCLSSFMIHFQFCCEAKLNMLKLV